MPTGKSLNISNIMKKLLKLFLPILIISPLFFMTSCEDLTEEEIDELLYGLGWTEEEEELEQIESSIYLGDGDLPPTVNLVDKFPPIGNQGKYGTCVTWAAGYNMKTMLEGVDRGLSTSQLADPANQFSPKDLFWAIPNNKKGGNCNGTNFEIAFDLLQSRGIATMASVPYTGLDDCADGTPNAWDSEAENFKIENYRKITPDISTVKTYLAQGRPVVIGARIGDNFLRWNNSSVISSDTYAYSGQHAYHALIVGGYDDNKGPNGAFKLINSWSTAWGDDGYIWMDYAFFQNSFCFAAFVAKNKLSNYNPDQDGDNQVDPDDIVTGSADLLAWDLADFDNPNETNPRARNIEYNVYNLGDRVIQASEEWNIAYIYYNAYDADEWGILLFDTYTDDRDSPDHNGPLEEGPGLSGNWWNNIDVPGGSSVAEVFGSSKFTWGYNVPENLNGYYYFVLVADGYDVISEYDESNNYYYFTDNFGYPIYVENGIIDDPIGKTNPQGLTPKPKPNKLSKAPSPTARTPQNLNTYTPEEIQAMIKYQRENGLLKSKIDAFKEANQYTKGME